MKNIDAEESTYKMNKISITKLQFDRKKSTLLRVKVWEWWACKQKTNIMREEKAEKH